MSTRCLAPARRPAPRPWEHRPKRAWPTAARAGSPRQAGSTAPQSDRPRSACERRTGAARAPWARHGPASRRHSPGSPSAAASPAAGRDPLFPSSSPPPVPKVARGAGVWLALSQTSVPGGALWVSPRAERFRGGHSIAYDGPAHAPDGDERHVVPRDQRPGPGAPTRPRTPGEPGKPLKDAVNGA